MSDFVNGSADGFKPTNAFKVIRGSTKSFNMITKDEDGNVLDLTGGRVLFTVKRDIEDPTPLIQKDSRVTGQIVITNPRAGSVAIKLVPADTAKLDPRLYLFDVWVVLADGSRYPVVPPSELEVVQSVTVIP